MYFFIEHLGCLLVTLQDETIQELVCKAVHSLLSAKVRGLQCSVSTNFCRKAAEESQLTEFVGKLMEFADEGLYKSLLKLSTALAELSLSTCTI